MQITNNSKKNISPHLHYKEVANESITMQLFDIIEENPNTSQTKIISRTGLAAGIVHSFMTNIISNGWVRAKQVNPKRWLYFVTPAGFLEKSRISINYLKRTLQSYRKLQEIVTISLESCVENGDINLLVAGSNELAEIAALNIKAEERLNLVGIVANVEGGEVVAAQEVLSLDAVKKLSFDKILDCDSTISEVLVNKYSVAKDQFIDPIKYITEVDILDT